MQDQNIHQLITGKCTREEVFSIVDTLTDALVFTKDVIKKESLKGKHT